MATTVNAQPKHIPEGVRVDRGTPTERVCYGFADYKKLLTFDVDFDTCQKKTKALEQKVALLQKAHEVNLTLIDIQTGTIQLLKKRGDDFAEAWKKENKLRHKLENRVTPQLWIAYGIAGVSLAALAGVLVYGAVTK